MRLRSAVLELMRGAASASLVVVVGCSGTESIHQDNAATLAPLAAAQPSPAPLAPTPPVVLTVTAPVVVVAPEVEPIPEALVAGDTATADESAPVQPVVVDAHRERRRPPPIAIAAPPDHVARPCGRG